MSIMSHGPAWPPGVADFYPPGVGHGPWITKITVLLWLGTAAVIVFFLAAYRKPRIVPTRGQWLAESIYSFVRDGIAREVIGAEGLRFAPYLTSLFCFVAVTNIFGVVPLAQISPNAHIAFPAFLGVISWAQFIYLGARRHGFVQYVKKTLRPPDVPIGVVLLLAPIEILQTFINRPITLAVRLFANMFAGHLILLVFTVGGFMLLGAQTVALRPLSVGAWLLAIVLTAFEAVVALLQAYVFTMLTASYLEGALAETH